MCKPEPTVIEVDGLDRNLGYRKIYFSVSLCLFPHIPFNTIKSYGQAIDRYGHKKFIEITEHINCLCDRPSASPRGNKATSNAYVRILETRNFNKIGKFKYLCHIQ